MFRIGDNIVYPMHGAGVIEAIEEKEIHGKKQQYYVIKMPSNMQLMIPEGKINSCGVRSVEDKKSLECTLKSFQHGETDCSLTWKQRYTANMEKMKSGNMQEGAEVVRDLMRMNKEKPLNSSERQMMHNARKMLISELGLIVGITENQASDLLDNRMTITG